MRAGELKFLLGISRTILLHAESLQQCPAVTMETALPWRQGETLPFDVFELLRTKDALGKVMVGRTPCFRVFLHCIFQTFLGEGSVIVRLNDRSVTVSFNHKLQRVAT